MAANYKRDWWLWPITVPTSARTIVLEEAGGAATSVSIAAGVYYTHRDSSIDADYPSLFLALETALNAAGLTNTYTFSAQTPTESVAQLKAGVRLTGVATSDGTPASVNFSLNFSSASFTLDPRVLGFDADRSTDASASGNTDAFALDSPLTVFGTWRAFSLFDGIAADKRGDERTLLIDSHDRPSDRYVLPWYEERYRTVKYMRVNAAHVYRYAAEQESYAHVGKLETNDTHNAFYHVWRELKFDNAPCIIVHNVGDEWDLQVDTYDSEAVKRAEKADDSFRKWTGEPARRAGEFYDLEIDLFIADDLPGYFH